MKKIFLSLMVFASLLFAQIDLSNIDVSTLSPDQLKAYQAYMSSGNVSSKPQLPEPTKQVVDNRVDLSPPPPPLDQGDKMRMMEDLSSPLDYRSNKEVFKSIQKDKIKKSTTELTKFGTSFFSNKNSVNPYSIPTSENYVLTNGDKLSVNIYGQQTNAFELEVDKNGNVQIPNIGFIKVGGLAYVDAKSTLNNALVKAYPQSTIVLDIVYYSTIQVYLTGEIKAPGLYNLPSFATVKDALVVGNGINETGSYRNIAVKRDGKVIEHFDAYKMIQFGENETPKLLRNGDVVVVGKSEKQISVAGQISTPGIYELKESESFKQLFAYASDFKFDASKEGLRLTRFVKNENIKIYTLNFEKLLSMKPQDGDYIEVFPLSMLSKRMVTLKGNIVYEGEREMPENSKLSSLLQKEINFYGKNNFFLENTAFDFGMIKRRNIEGNYEIVAFDVNDILNKSKDLALKDADEIYIPNKLQLAENPYIYVSGKVVEKQGRYQFFDNMQLQSLFKSIQFKTELVGEADTPSKSLHVNKDYIRLARIHDKKTEVHILALPKDAHFTLNAYDRVEFFDFYDTNSRFTASITGEVFNTGSYDIYEGMKVEDLVRLSGGTTKKAYLKNIELVRYKVVNNERIRDVLQLDLNKEEDKKMALMDDDEVIVRTIPKWGEKKYIELVGQVKFPGKYTIENNEKLADIIARAGGFTDEAFIKGSVYTRKSIQELQQKELLKSLAELKNQTMYAASVPSETKDTNTEKMLLAMVSSLETEAAKNMPIGRMVIELSKNIEKFKQSPYNVMVEDGDKLYIPKPNQTVTVMGEVMSSNSFIFDDKLAIDDYIQKAGGYKKESADKGSIYVIKNNGNAQRLDSGYFLSSNINLEYGDTIIVPRKIEVTSNMSIISAVADITYKLAITVASLSTVGAI